MKKTLYFYSNIVAWALILFLIGNYAFGWVTPDDDPPEGDLPFAPLDTSSTSQTKNGDLTIDSLLKIGRYSSAPSGSTGALYFDTTANEFKGYKSTGWASFGGGGGVWGSITGTLSSQTDLQGVLDGKLSTGHTTTYDHALLHSNSNDPTTDQKAALAGTNGTPSVTNKFVTNTDPRNTDARTPTSHNQDASTINAGTLDGDRLPAISTTKKGGVPLTGTPSGKYLKDDGTWATPGGGTAYTLVAKLASDQATGANTTPVSLTGLVFTYEANSTYRIWFMGRVAPAVATTGCGFQFDLSSAVTSINVIFYHQLTKAGTTSGGQSIADDASVGVSSGMPGTSTYTVSGEGILITTSNTGTAQMRFRSETTAVTTAKAGMTLVVEKIQ